MSVKTEVIDGGDGVHKVQTSVDGKGVGWLSVIDLRMHYGLSKIDVGGIAGVYTEREFRERGYSRRTMNYALEWMRAREYPLASLFGIPEYYHRYGFENFMGQHSARIYLRNLSKIETSGNYQLALYEDPSYRLEEIIELYEETNMERVASRVREPSLWKRFRGDGFGGHIPKVLAAEENNKVVGYALIERWPPPNEFPIVEINALNHSYAVYRFLLKEIYKIMAEDLKTLAVLHIPPDHPVAEVLRAYGCYFESRYPWREGGMARIVSLKRVLTSIEEELKRRSKGLEGTVCIKLPSEAATLIVNDGSIEVRDGVHAANIVKMGYGEAAQLILGYRNPYELLSAVEAHGSIGVLTKLFPEWIPYVWSLDRW